MLGRVAGLVLGVTVLAACAAVPAPKAGVSPSPTSGVAATQTPSANPTVLGVATVTTGTCRCSTLHLISVGGIPLGSVTLAAGVQPVLDAGPAGVYFVLGYQLLRLGADGATTPVGKVALAPTGREPSVSPDPQLGALAVAPGGTEWAYLQTVGGGGSQTNQVWLGEAHRRPRLLVSSGQNVGPPSSEFPAGWSYRLLGWAGGSLVVAQVASGADSFATAALEVSLVNPQTGTQTVLSNSPNCPVSALAAGGGYLCFQQGGGQATELVTGAAGIITGAWSLAAGNGYGAAVFDPAASRILFADCPGCAASPSAAYLGSRMEVLDTDSGALQALGAPGLVPDAWLPTGQIVATQYTQLHAARPGSAPLSAVVLVDPASGQVTALTHDSSSQFVGVAIS